MSSVSFEDLHTRFYGAQDRYDAADFVNTYPRAGSVIEHCKCDHIKKSTIILLPCGANYGVANLRLSGDWISARLIVGGQRFDRIFKHLGHTGFWYTSGDRAFPGLSAHETHVEVEGDGASVSWDKVTVENFDADNISEIYALACQFNGTETLLNGNSQIKLHYNHPVFAIYVKTDKPVKGLTLDIDGITLDAFVWNGLQWELVFQEIPTDSVPLSSRKTLNFSRIDKSVLHVHHDHDSVSVDTHVVTSQITRIMRGMAGLAFTK